VPSRDAVLASVAALVVVAGAVGIGVVGSSQPSRVVGAETAPPWPVPPVGDRLGRAEVAGMENVWGEELAMHVHSHLSITVEGESVTIPGDIGHDADTKLAAPLHTHDTSGIVHVESPRRESLVLGQLFTEWDVHLDAASIGSLGPDDGLDLVVFVDGSRRSGDPSDIRLRDFADVALVLAPRGETVAAPPAFDWPDDYR
jgi:hypothetical protein